MRKFSKFIEELSLVDLPLIEGSFTLHRGLNRQSMKRIPFFLIKSDLEDHFTNTMQILLPRPAFDHFPTLMGGDGVYLKTCGSRWRDSKI